MREIKFRAWDEINKTMIYPDFPENLRGLTSADILKRWSPEWIMQYTGLKDSTKWEELTKEEQQAWLDSGKTEKEWSGKEIYSGDIVKAYHYEFKEKNIGIVIYKDFCYQLKQLKQSKQALEHGYIDCIRYWSDGSHDWYSMEQYEKEDLEVIGNIHENPELLEANET